MWYFRAKLHLYGWVVCLFPPTIFRIPRITHNYRHTVRLTQIVTEKTYGTKKKKKLLPRLAINYANVWLCHSVLKLLLALKVKNSGTTLVKASLKHIMSTRWWCAYTDIKLKLLTLKWCPLFITGFEPICCDLAWVTMTALVKQQRRELRLSHFNKLLESAIWM